MAGETQGPNQADIDRMNQSRAESTQELIKGGAGIKPTLNIERGEIKNEFFLTEEQINLAHLEMEADLAAKQYQEAKEKYEGKDTSDSESNQDELGNEATPATEDSPTKIEDEPDLSDEIDKEVSSVPEDEDNIGNNEVEDDIEDNEDEDDIEGNEDELAESDINDSEATVESKENEEAKNGSIDLENYPGYEDIKDTRDAYLRLQAGRRKWFKRPSPEDVEFLEKNYREEFNEFVAKNCKKDPENPTVNLSKGELTQEEFNNLQTDIATRMLVSEAENRSIAEAQISSEGTYNKIATTLRRHPGIRFGVSAALLGASVGAGLTGALPLSAGLLATRAAWNGIGTTISVDGAIDMAQGHFMKKKLDVARGEQTEDGTEVSSDVKHLRTEEVYDLAGEVMARATRRGEDYRNTSETDALKALLEEEKRDMKISYQENLIFHDNDAEKARISMIEKYMSLQNESLEEGQEKERKSSIKRMLVAGSAGVLAGGFTLFSGIGKLSEGAAAVHAHEVAGNANGGSGGVAGTEAIASKVPRPSFSYSETAMRNASEWKISENAITRYAAKMGIKLTDKQLLFATDMMKDNMNAHNSTAHNFLHIGDKFNITETGWSGIINGKEVSGTVGVKDVIKTAIENAK